RGWGGDEHRRPLCRDATASVEGLRYAAGMRWSRSWALAAVAALGCSRGSAPGPELKEPEPPSAPGRDLLRPLTSAPDPPPASAPVPPALPSFLLTELAPTQGNLTPLLVAQVERGRAKQLRTVVELYADWCPPCRTFQDHLEDARMKEALKGVYLVKLNLDDW